VIDVGAAGKGYLVDIVSAILQQAGVARFVVDAGGDLRHWGEHGIRVGLEHPLDPRLVIGVADLQNRALCASAVNRRAWGNGLHHVLDARTGVPATEVLATWVVADDAALADGLATALFFTGAHRLAEIFRFAYVRMLADGRAERSPDFDGELFTRAPTRGDYPPQGGRPISHNHKEGHESPAQQDPADDDHRSFCRCGHRWMRDDGRGRHNSIVGLEHQRRRSELTLQPTLQVRRRHLHRHRSIRRPSLKHRRVRHPRR
jgi:hypothetical protein